MSPDGDAVAVWVQFDGDEDTIWASRYLDGVGWSAGQPIEPPDTLPAKIVRVAVDREGRAVVIWNTTSTNETNALEVLWSNRLE